MTYVVQHPKGDLTIRTVRPSLLRRNPPLHLRWRPHVPTHASTPLRDPFTGLRADIDNGIVEDIQALWDVGVQTFHSCQGGPVWLLWPADLAYVSVRPSQVPAALELLPWADLTVDVPTCFGRVAIRGLR